MINNAKHNVNQIELVHDRKLGVFVLFKFMLFILFMFQFTVINNYQSILSLSEIKMELTENEERSNYESDMDFEEFLLSSHKDLLVIESKLFYSKTAFIENLIASDFHFIQTPPPELI